MHLKQVFGFCLITITSVVLCGCNGSGENGTTAERKFINLGTAPTGGAFHPVGCAAANVVTENKGDLNWVVTPQGTKGTQENIRRLESDELQFAMANAAISYFAVKGEGAWEKPYQIRAVATIAPNIGIFVTTKSSGINKISDLKGKRVVLGPSGAGFDYFLKPLLQAHGVTYDDLTPLNGNYIDAGDMLADGKADAAFMGGAIPIPAVVQLCSTQDVGFLPFDEAVVEKLKDYPFYSVVKDIPADTYSDLDQDLKAINVGNMQLITHANVDEDVVYHFTKIMYENRDKMAERHPAAKAINPKNAVRDTGTPFHPGAIKYYKEAGIWPTE
ncbi:MAG: TAXI family TRAP transporter solute-binding subunit [Mariniblastus sp.]|nr:TAXI family TRAP transporter solute-binding subunit [Mariniblastus sp.]